MDDKDYKYEYTTTKLTGLSSRYISIPASIIMDNEFLKGMFFPHVIFIFLGRTAEPCFECGDADHHPFRRRTALYGGGHALHLVHR